MSKEQIWHENLVCDNCESDQLGEVAKGDENRGGYDAHCFGCDNPTTAVPKPTPFN